MGRWERSKGLGRRNHEQSILYGKKSFHYKCKINNNKKETQRTDYTECRSFNSTKPVATKVKKQRTEWALSVSKVRNSCGAAAKPKRSKTGQEN